MSLIRGDLIAKMNEASFELLREQGYMTFVDVLIALGKLTHEDYERWRFRRIPCLEQAVTINLAKVNTLLRPIHENAKHGGLRASRTAYLSWGKEAKRRLRFSQSGDQHRGVRDAFPKIEPIKRGVTSVPTPRCCPLQAGERGLDR